MVYDKDDLQTMPQLNFTHSELALVYQAAKGNRDITTKTLQKLKVLWNYSRTKSAFAKPGQQATTTITLS